MGKSKLKIFGCLILQEAGAELQFSYNDGRGKSFRHNFRLSLSQEDLAKQEHEPVCLKDLGKSIWLFRGVGVNAAEFGEVPPEQQDELCLRIKYFVLRQEKELSRIRREVEAFQNLERLPSARREAIPEAVRMFVWQRDQGKCVKCGGNEKLEFDHIIPVADGGSTTERNVQLLCEGCNRSKGRNVC